MKINLSECTAIPLPDPLPKVTLKQLHAIKTRKQLERSPLYQEHSEHIRKITEAIAYGRSTHSAPISEHKFLRIASWNIERGRNVEEIIKALRTDQDLMHLDHLLLCEVDAGMARSDNRFVAQEIAEALGYEWVFGNSYLCLDHGDIRDGHQREDNQMGLHGNAILSRHPLTVAQNCSLYITKDKFMSRYEKRLGHKKALWATSQTPLGEVTLAAAHLDVFASFSDRRRQVLDLLTLLEDQRHLIFAGDMNTTTFEMGKLTQILRDIAKMLHKGVGHMLHHYLHPYERYERPVFDAFDEHFLEWRTFNDLSRETIRFDVNDPRRFDELKEKVPEFLARLIQSRVGRHGGVARGRLDWITARGFKPLLDGEIIEEEGRVSLAPRTKRLCGLNGEELSDHDVVVADVIFQR